MAAPRVEQDRLQSHGRGGAGNLAKDDPSNLPKPSDLVTPTLKADQYTTGRGGAGNIAPNDPAHPEVARAAQDVDGPATSKEPTGPSHYGRGGAANVADKDGKRKSGDVKRKSEDVKRAEVASKKEGGLSAKIKALIERFTGGSKKTATTPTATSAQPATTTTTAQPATTA